MLRVEFHCHTSSSKDCLTSLRTLVAAARRRGLDRLVVTDHNTIAGAAAAYTLDPDLVIVGEEIMTTRGELLAAFVTQEIPAGLPPQQTIELLRAQGAFISVSHPFDSARKGAWRMEDLQQLVPLVDAIEVFNSRCMLPHANDKALAFAHQYRLAGTVGSDAHTTWEVGRSVLSLEPFSDADGLRSVIRRGVPEMHASPAWIHLTSRYARLRKSLGIGLDMPRRT